ncbi:hypothetical protein PSCLAVI8L_130150 [Pseudoclavibacter sp. 8L]|nr:hypothetical protein PSCLAVI8L_130150 [Pseudoclavibacter sp. 8L]
MGVQVPPRAQVERPGSFLPGLSCSFPQLSCSLPQVICDALPDALRSETARRETLGNLGLPGQAPQVTLDDVHPPSSQECTSAR